MTDTKQVKERPILFSTPMVRAILEGRKTMTRRVIKGAPLRDILQDWLFGPNDPEILNQCPYGRPGDRLYVRETFAHLGDEDNSWIVYRADNNAALDNLIAKWRAPIHMPRTASRILLEITAVRVERLQEISRDDAKAEGATKAYFNKEGYYTAHEEGTYIEGFESIWQSINGKESWEANPWVWVIEFKRIEP